MRFAGDFFGVPSEQEPDQSKLLQYFPSLKNTFNYAQQPQKDKNTPRLTGNLQGSRAFAGFKLFETSK